MFTVKHNECVGFESKWKVKKVFSETTTQTTEFSVSEKGCSTVEQKSQDVQTMLDDTLPQGEVDFDRLAEWLSKIYPKVKKEIDNANNSKVFRNYRLLDDSVDATCKMVQNLTVASVGNSGDKAKPIVACLDWNHFGKTLALAHNFKHRAWCHHTGLVFIYLLSRDKLGETPKKRLSTESCVTTIKYHPSNGTILAAGTFAGKIYIWNTDNDIDPILCNIVAHDEFITQISWTNDIDSATSMLLASSSTDGLIKMWNFNIGEGVIKIKNVYKIKTPLFGKISQSLEVPKSISDRGDVGIVGFDFSKNFTDMFVVATEGGMIARCSMLGATKLKENSDGVQEYDPVFKYYEPHQGEIVAIRFSLSQKDMFLTSATDGEIRIYLLDQDEPAQVIFTDSPINDVLYILHEEKLIVACGQRGLLEVFHLIKGKPIELTFNTKVTKRTLTSLAINHVKTNCVVVGNDIGEIQLWNIPWQNFEVGNRR